MLGSGSGQSRWRSLSILTLVAVLAVVGLGVAASAQPGGEVEPNSDALHRTTKTVCVTSDAMGETSCATALLESRVYCPYRCEVVSQLSLVTQGSRDDFEALGTAGSQALSDTTAEAWIHTASQTDPVTITYDGDEIPTVGKTVSYESEVCVRFTLSPEQTGADRVMSDSACEDWTHHVWLRPAYYTTTTFLVSNIPRAEATAKNAATDPGRIELHDRSSSQVCGSHDLGQAGCGASRVLHTTPSCSDDDGGLTCSIDYWIETQMTGVGCVRTTTDQFSDRPVHCLQDDGRYSSHGPYTVVYDVPAEGRTVTVGAESCLGGDDYIFQCTQWSPATIELPGG